MDKILKERIETASAHFADKHPKVSAASVVYSRRDAFQTGAVYALSNQWISVDESLPDTTEDVLAACKETFHVAWFNGGKGEGYDEEGILIKPTHWMPIPELIKRNRNITDYGRRETAHPRRVRVQPHGDRGRDLNEERNEQWNER